MMKRVLRIGFIPEHFATPLAFADKHGFLAKRGIENYKLVPFPSGSGHLISALKNGEVEIVVGLTEAFVRGISGGDTEYEIVGEYVKSPLCWSISTGHSRNDLQSIDDLKKIAGGANIGVSRIGSGSYVMSFVLALQEKFPDKFNFKVLDNFKNLRASVNDGTTDAFMWEYFTSKPYYDNGEIKPIGEIYTPWASWVVASSTKLPAEEVSNFILALQDGVNYYKTHEEEAIEYILSELDYNDRNDLELWAQRVEFSDNIGDFNKQAMFADTLETLKAANVL